MMDLSQDLVSITMDLIGVGSETGNEKVLCDHLYDTLESYTGALTRVGNSFIYHLDFRFNETFALVGHLDTVPIGESTVKAYLEDNCIWGRGACDMKSGLAIMLKIIEEIENGKIQPLHNLTFVFYEKEEGPLPNGINSLLEKNLLQSIDFAFVLEPTESLYSVACLGSIAAKKEIKGISAHSANPETGVNALDEALGIYEKIKIMNSRIGAKQFIEEMSFYETVNVTSLKTFNAMNVIPAHVEMIINFRFSPHRSLEEAKELLITHVGSYGLIFLDESPSAYVSKEKRSFLSDKIESEVMQAWTDIAQLNQVGINSINFGPGSIKWAHKPDERINIRELKDYYKILIQHL